MFLGKPNSKRFGRLVYAGCSAMPQSCAGIIRNRMNNQRSKNYNRETKP